MKWEFADLAEQTAKGLRKHFETVGYPYALHLDRAHWHLIVLALERAAESDKEHDLRVLREWKARENCEA